jgi:small subunit ribosomal protein S8
MSQISDPIADFLTRLRNASRAAKLEVLVPYSKIKAEMARLLKEEGYIASYAVEMPEKGHPQIKIINKLNSRATAITGLKRISRPGLRRYVGATEIPRVLGGMGVAILSTPRGILTGREAKKLNVGGELLAYVW